MFPSRGRLYQYTAALACQLSLVAAGSAFMWLEPFTLRLTQGEVEGLVLSSKTVSWLVTIIEVGCLLSPPLSGILVNKFGRKWVILSTGPLYLGSWLLLLFSTSLPVIYLARFLQGLAVGVTITVTPIYTAEIADPEVRGWLSGVAMVAWEGGVLYSFVIGPFFTYWNYIIASIPIPLLFMVAFAFFHETPYFFLMSGRTEEAKRSLVAFRGTRDVSREFEEMRNAVAEEMSPESSWGTLFGDPLERRAFIIVQIVAASKSFTGLPTLMNYAIEIFSIRRGLLSPEKLSIIFGCLLCGIGVISAFLSDFIGRKCLLLVSCFGAFVSHLLTGMYFFLQEKTSVNVDPFVILMYIGLIGYCFSCDIGFGSLLYTLKAEMFSSKTRGLAGGLTESSVASFSFLALIAYRPVREHFGFYLNFLVYSGVALISGILLTFLMVETKGKTIGKMKSGVKNYSTKL